MQPIAFKPTAQNQNNPQCRHKFQSKTHTLAWTHEEQNYDQQLYLAHRSIYDKTHWFFVPAITPDLMQYKNHSIV